MAFSRLTRTLTLTLILCSVRSQVSRGQTPAPTEVDRLVGLGQLWGTIKYSHPWVASRSDIDWDKALVDAIPDARRAANVAQYAQAVQRMLDALGDPATRLTLPDGGPPSGPPSRRPSAQRSQLITPDSILVATMPPFSQSEGRGASLWADSIRANARRARAVVLDLRSGGVAADRGPTGLFRTIRSLIAEPVVMPSQRVRIHFGFHGESINGGAIDPVYQSGFFTRDASRLPPLPSSVSRPIVFLVDSATELTEEMLALQHAGRALIVAEGGASDRAIINTIDSDLPYGLHATLRTSDCVFEDGTGGLRPDSVVRGNSTSDPDAARTVAVALAGRFAPSRGSPRLPTRAEYAVVRPYDESGYPATEYRLLAAFKIWSVIHFFSPYVKLAGENWDNVLKEFVPKMELARDGDDYAATAFAMLVRLHDGHSFNLSSTKGAFRRIMGERAPFYVDFVEGKLVVTAWKDEQSGRATGIRIGDIIHMINGQPVAKRIDSVRSRVAASTPQGESVMSAFFAIRGPDSSSVVLNVEGSDGKRRDVTVPISRRNFGSVIPLDTAGPHFRLLTPEIGYAKLGTLKPNEVDSMFRVFEHTKALIIDDRLLTGSATDAILARIVASDSIRLNGGGGIPVVTFGTYGDYVDPASSRIGLSSTLPPRDGPRYAGKPILLVGPMTASYGETIATEFREVGAFIVGGQTSGTNGDVTSFVIPGGITFEFTGGDVRQNRGAQLQRVGIKPDLEVRPTIRGVRAGRDEVLEAAVSYLHGKGK
jgi:C-terminal processing protease CtpA/Prc